MNSHEVLELASGWCWTDIIGEFLYFNPSIVLSNRFSMGNICNSCNSHLAHCSSGICAV